MNIIGIDISIDSTGMSINRGDELLLFNFTILKNSVGWIKKTMTFVDYEFINYTYKDIENYTESELMKLREYDLVTDKIYNKILGNIDKNEETYIAVEGYNYGLKNTNSIVDIVTFSTLLRMKLLDIPKLEKIIFISPKSLKSEVASMVYGFTLNKNGKKIINKNLNGVSGGSFDKKDMLVALYHMNEDNKFSKLLNTYKDDLLKLKNVPRPWDDLVDSYFIMLTLTI
jgi:hypothetical protein